MLKLLLKLRNDNNGISEMIPSDSINDKAASTGIFWPSSLGIFDVSTSCDSRRIRRVDHPREFSFQEISGLPPTLQCMRHDQLGSYLENMLV